MIVFYFVLPAFENRSLLSNGREQKEKKKHSILKTAPKGFLKTRKLK